MDGNYANGRFENNAHQANFDDVIYVSSDDEDVIDLTEDDQQMPSTSTIYRFPSELYESDDEFAEEDPEVSIVYERRKPGPQLSVEIKHDEVVVDFMQKDCTPVREGFKICRSILGPGTDLGLNVIFQIGSKDADSKKEQNAEPPVELNNAPRAALYCGICSNSHIQILQSGRSLITSLCGHVFCNVCLNRYPESHKKCLTCGNELTLQQYHPLYH